MTADEKLIKAIGDLNVVNIGGEWQVCEGDREGSVTLINWLKTEKPADTSQPECKLNNPELWKRIERVAENTKHLPAWQRGSAVNEREPEPPAERSVVIPERWKNEKRCCIVCDARKVCHVCGSQTLMACSDCRINFGVTVYVCTKSSCRDEHERKCFGDGSKPAAAEAERDAALALVKDYEEVNKDKNRLVRELDVVMRGVEGAAKQASLCDLISPARNLKAERDAALRERDEAESGRWQKAIYDAIRKHVPYPDSIDGGGCDSGDPLDFSVAEIEEGLGQLQAQRDTLLNALRDARQKVTEVVDELLVNPCHKHISNARMRGAALVRNEVVPIIDAAIRSVEEKARSEKNVS